MGEVSRGLVGVGKVSVGIRVIRAQANLFTVFLHKARDVARGLQCFRQVAVIAGLIGRKIDGLAQLSGRLHQVSGLAQNQTQRLVQRRVGGPQAYRFMVFTDRRGMVADREVGGSKLRMGGNIVGLQTDDSAELLDSPSVIVGLAHSQRKCHAVVHLIGAQLHRQPVLLDGVRQILGGLQGGGQAHVDFRVVGTQASGGAILVDAPGKISSLGQRGGQAGMGVSVVGVQLNGLAILRPRSLGIAGLQQRTGQGHDELPRRAARARALLDTPWQPR